MRIVNGWTWDEESKRWYVTRGTVRITVRLARNDPPEFDAGLFGVQKENVSKGIQIGDGNIQNNVF
jgi:hypothetical protein